MIYMISDNEVEFAQKPHPDAFISNDEHIRDQVYLIEVTDMVQLLQDIEETTGSDPIVYLASYHDEPMLMIELNV